MSSDVSPTANTPALDPDRLRHAAEALAAVYGDAWDDLDDDARAHYGKEAEAVVHALTAYDSLRHGAKIRDGIVKGRALGNTGQGRYPRGSSQPGVNIPAHIDRRIRKMLRAGDTQAVIKNALGVGASTVQRIRWQIIESRGLLRVEQSKENRRVDARPATAKHSQSGDLQIQPPKRGRPRIRFGGERDRAV